MQKPTMKYEYEGIRYDITIHEVMVYPQCYSAVAPRLFHMKGDYLVVDIGSKTTDVIFLKDGIPVESRCITIEKGDGEMDETDTGEPAGAVRKECTGKRDTEGNPETALPSFKEPCKPDP